ncbi:hypothetical protein [Synechocystis sp. LKSZ1]|uniref:hypothetical protein n=1 Tax=Synechocystis sp. LKSZ1 TaxID=3144951 RepID=UPI00336BBE8E
MTWTNLFGANLTNDWLFSVPTAGEWFRVHAQLPAGILPPSRFWGYIGQAGRTLTQKPNLFDVQRLYPTPEPQVIQLVAPPIWANDRALALKGINYRYSRLGFSWFVTVQVWTESS